ncbi:MAG: class I SAM-dependent methyltransferase [Chloroflexi bacterium]|nr:class I SAM-dependent methyltransferase [Chloroflexota bacterium]
MNNRYSSTWFEIFLETIEPIQNKNEIEFIQRRLPNPPYATILDLGCGEGRHARELSARDYRVTGIDVNPRALKKAHAMDSRTKFVELDMRELEKLSNRFDAAICMWQSFGYFDQETNANVLEQISCKLNPRGRLILDIYNRGFFETHQGTRQFERKGARIIEKKFMRGNRLTVELNYGNGLTDKFDWQLFARDEICARARRFCFEPLVFCTEFDERESASADKPRMQIVFEKVEKESGRALRK